MKQNIKQYNKECSEISEHSLHVMKNILYLLIHKKLSYQSKYQKY